MTTTSRVRVLVVEDEASVRNSLTGFFEDYDFDIFAAESAERALEVLEREPIHVAIVDIRLPGMNGDVFILKAHDMVPSMRFIIYTGSMDYQLSEDLERIGIQPEHLFLKPQRDLSVFADMIQKLVGE